MTWLTAIISFFKGLSVAINGLREAYWLWENARNERAKERIDNDVKRKHDSLRDGNVPRRD